MSAGSAVFCYDLNGNMTQRIEGNDTYTFTYDTENRLVTGAKNGVMLASYVYDGDGKRVKVVEGVNTTYYIGDYYEWRTYPMVKAVKYHYAAGQRIAMRQGGVLTWLLGDHLGSTTITANENGTLATEQRYTAWGQTRSGSVTTDRQYTGQISEPQLGIYFYNARYYDPYLARFVSPDSIIPQPGNPMAWDRYSYVNNSPVNYTDPSGHRPVCSEADACGPYTIYHRSNRFNLVAQLPVNKDNTGWIQWYGGTEYAYEDHINYITGNENWNYDGYCQGYHCGIDFGAEWGTSVYAGTYGTVIQTGIGNAGYFVIIEFGDYHFYYQGLDGEFNVSVGDSVRPNTLIAGVGNHSGVPEDGNTHLHFEIRHSSSGRGDYKDRIANPLLFMDMSLYNQLLSRTPYSSATLVTFHTNEQDPKKQVSPIIRGGASLWE